jgi:DNA-directed RNA polymerase specialized sigma24 family protein
VKATEYLSKARKLEIKILQKRQQLEGLKQVPASMRADRERVQHTLTGDDMDKRIIEYLELERKIEDDILRYQKEKDRIIDTIHGLDNSNYLTILHAKWIDGDSLEKISVAMNYSFDTIRKYYSRAMKAIQQEINDIS